MAQQRQFLNLNDIQYTFDKEYTNIKSIMTITATLTKADYAISYYSTRGVVNENPIAYNMDSEAIILTNISFSFC